MTEQGRKARVWVVGVRREEAGASSINAALRFAQSLRWFGGRASRDAFLLVLHDANDSSGGGPQIALNSEAELAGVEVLLVRTPQSAMLAPATLRAAAQRFPSHQLIVSQPFTIVLGDPIDHLPQDTIGVSAPDVLPWRADAVASWFESVGLDAFVQRSTRYGDVSTPMVASAEFLVVPDSVVDALCAAWEHWAASSREAVAILEPALTRPRSVFLNDASSRMALSAALNRELAWSELPTGFDVPSYMSGNHVAGAEKPITVRYLPGMEGPWTTGKQPLFPSGPSAGIDLFDRLRAWSSVGVSEPLQRPTRTQGPAFWARREGFRWDRGIGIPQRLEGPRLMIAAAPRCGNNWLSHLLGSLYDLPVATAPESLEELTAIRWDRFVMYQHFVPSPQLLEWGRELGVRFLTLVRHPADMFVSLHHFVNRMAEASNREILDQPSFGNLIGKPLGGHDSLSFIENDFDELRCSFAWVLSEAAMVVRYEDLLDEPEATLASLAQRLGPVDPARFQRAIDACSKSNLRSKSEFLNIVVREGVSGEGNRILPPSHLDAIRHRYGDWMDVLGYT